MKYVPTIGLEIHAELNTETKMFCSCKNDPDEERPNINVCPICLGHPGTLPVINRNAVRKVLEIGVALGGEFLDMTKFDRKNYFYPDIPKGYQISQYKWPLVKGGSLSGVAITRVHLEEDTGTSTHESGEYSLINFNRAGVPLMELVTGPVIHSASEATKFARELQLVLQYLGAANANMEKGEMRVEANVSISPKSKVQSRKLGTKVEIKNLNSFKTAERAIEYEILRQGEALERGEKVAQETRGWDEKRGTTVSQRQKEESHDYRYFPDPDLLNIMVSAIDEFGREFIKRKLPELPSDRRGRIETRYGLKKSDIEYYIANKIYFDFFESVAECLSNKNNTSYQLLSNYIVSDLSALTGAVNRVLPRNFAKLIDMIGEQKISSRGAKDILQIMIENGDDPVKIAEKHNLTQKSAENELDNIVDRVIEENKSIAEQYRAGKTTALQYLVGQGMKLSNGSANPQVLRDLLIKKIK